MSNLRYKFLPGTTTRGQCLECQPIHWQGVWASGGKLYSLQGVVCRSPPARPFSKGKWLSRPLSPLWIWELCIQVMLQLCLEIALLRSAMQACLAGELADL